jgi:hypothetical protein
MFRVIVALAIERLVAIRFPLLSKHICSVTHARRIICLILAFTMVVQSYHLVIKGLDCSSPSMSRSTSLCRCKTLPKHVEWDILLTIYVWRLILMTLLPLTIIISVNILIMSKLFNENSLIDHTNNANNGRRKTLLLHKISRMLVIVSSIYLLLHVPGSSLEIIKVTIVYVFEVCNAKWQYYISVTGDFFDLLTNLNYAINFYLYIISGKHIRNEFMRSQSCFRLYRAKTSIKFQRSSYFTSSYIQPPRSPHTDSTRLALARCPTAASI